MPVPRSMFFVPPKNMMPMNLEEKIEALAARYTSGEVSDALIDEARVLVDEASAVADEKLVGRSLQLIGAFESRRNDIDEAILCFAESVEHFLAADEKGLSGQALYNLGSMRMERGEFDAARSDYERSIEILESIPPSKRLIDAYVHYAILRRYLREYREAHALLDQAEELMARDGFESIRRHNQGHVKFARAAICKSSGEVNEAIRLYREAILDDEAIGHVSKAADCRVNLASLYEESGNIETAIEILTPAIAYYRESGNTFNLGIALYNIGLLNLKLSRSGVAREHLKEARDLLANRGNPRYEAGTLLSLAETYDATEERDSVRASILSCEPILAAITIPRDRADVASSMARLSVGIDDFEAAEKYGRIGLEESEDELTFRHRALLALVDSALHRDDLEEAEKLCTEAQEIADTSPVLRLKLDALRKRVDVLRARSEWQEALTLYERYHDLERQIHNDEALTKASVMEASLRLSAVEKERSLISEQNAELEKLNEHLTQLNAEKDGLLAIASHDLKNPLASITLQIGLLERNLAETGSAETIESLARIRNRTQGMIDLISRILDTHDLDADAESLESTPFDLAEAVGRVVESFATQASEKEIDLDFKSQPVTVLADRPSLIRIAENLISNGLKYTPSGGCVTVRVEDAGEQARLIVSDTGPGVAPSDRDRLFRRFARLSTRPTGSESQTGLGLWIVKRLAEAMGGSVRYEDEGGGGACFKVELPTAP